MKLSLFVLLLVGAAFILGPQLVSAAHCDTQIRRGDFFDTFEQAEYANGLLVLHLKLTVPFNQILAISGLPLKSSIGFVNDECRQGHIGSAGGGGQVSISPNTLHFSLRFTSPTHFDIWNDDLDRKEECSGCSQDITVQFPGYYEFIFFGIFDSSNFFQTRSYRISGSAPDPPIKIGTLPLPSGCAPFRADGYFFDNYEHAEYVNGFLIYHFRQKSPYNNGRPWYSSLNFHDGDCSVRGGTGQIVFGTRLTPYIRYYSVRFSSPTHYDIWNDEANTRETCPACSADIPATLANGSPYAYVSFFAYIDPDSGNVLNSTPFPIQESPGGRNPIVIVPGIGASWNWKVMLGVPPNKWGFTSGVHYYDGLIDSLTSLGYQKDRDLFVAFYDWRKSNDIGQSGNSVVNYLTPVIDRAKAACGCNKVDIIAHSMGGLVARSYIQSDDYLARNDVDKLFLIGTPNRGSSDVYTLWGGGRIPENWDSGLQSEIFFYTWALAENKFLGRSDLERYFTIHSMVPSVQELLPAYDFVAQNGNSKSTASMIEQNHFLPNLNSSLNSLISRVKTYTIVGDGQLTVNQIPVINRGVNDAPLWVDGKPSPLTPIPDDLKGDNTVLLSSADVPGTLGSTTLAVTHSLLVDKSEKFITNTLGLTLQGDFPSVHFTNALSYWFASPVAVKIVDPLGRIITKDLSQAPNAEYDGENDPAGFKAIFIGDPDPGEYKLELTGVADGGEYHLAMDQISTSSEISTVAAGNIKPDQVITYTGQFNPTSKEPVSIKPDDQVPPEIIIASPESNDYLRSQVLPVKVSISDSGTGVFSKEIKFDEETVKDGDGVDLFFQRLGDHAVTAKASDFVGNVSEKVSSFRIIVTAESTISDVERLFTLRWIDNAGVKQSLIKKLTKLNKERPGKIKFKDFLHELDAQRGKHINESAYQLLVEDINWLLSH